MAETELLRVENLTRRFRLEKNVHLVAVNNVSFSLARGETLGLVGESGSGKTTVGRCVLRLIEPSEGRVILDGTDVIGLKPEAVRRLRARMQLVFQDPFGSLNPRLSVLATVEEPLALHDVTDRAERRRRAAEMLGRVNLGPRFHGYYPADLTASEQQRVGIARALVTKPDLVVLDEPTSQLDPTARAEIIRLLQSVQQEMGTAYIFISHDLTSVAKISHRIAIMYLGHIVEMAPTDEIMAEQRHPYSRALLSAVLFPDPKRKPDPYVIEGEIPTAINPKAECPLYGRCPIREPACADAVPPLLEIKPAHRTACRRWEHVGDAWAPMGEPADA
ncbi:MAG: oligopeptide/dipeptide ABC transporter ATP-binding protein [Alphaproteobacteria bacterium]